MYQQLPKCWAYAPIIIICTYVCTQDIQGVVRSGGLSSHSTKKCTRFAANLIYMFGGTIHQNQQVPNEKHCWLGRCRLGRATVWFEPNLFIKFGIISRKSEPIQRVGRIDVRLFSTCIAIPSLNKTIDHQIPNSKSM